MCCVLGIGVLIGIAVFLPGYWFAAVAYWYAVFAGHGYAVCVVLVCCFLGIGALFIGHCCTVFHMFC